LGCFGWGSKTCSERAWYDPCVTETEVNRDATPAWRRDELTDPHGTPDKADRVRRMFAAIADSYDLNNRVHSLGRDQAWRRVAVRMCDVQRGDVVLDVACGTGDLTLAFAEAGCARVLGLDFTHEMMRVGQHKRDQHATRHGAMAPIAFADGDALRLPVADDSVDVVSIAFGIRNVADPARALAEFRRVLRPGGRVMILEFSQPRLAPLRWAYHLYFHHVLPRTATWIARDRSGAYRYLPQSVQTFIDKPAMIDRMTCAGFGHIRTRTLTFGIAIAYRGIL